MKFVFGMLASIYLLAGATLADTNAALNSRFQGYYDALHAAFMAKDPLLAKSLLDDGFVSIELSDERKTAD